MQNLNFSDGLFDVAVCAFGIFFVKDMENQLLRIASTVKPGGRIMISNFQEKILNITINNPNMPPKNSNLVLMISWKRDASSNKITPFQVVLSSFW